MKWICLFLFFLICANLPAEKVGNQYVRDPYRQDALPAASGTGLDSGFFQAEIACGNLVLSGVQNDSFSGMTHRRYRQMHRGLPVWGGEIILHEKGGRVVYCDGEYYRIGGLDLAGLLEAADAGVRFAAATGEEGLSVRPGETELVVFPQSETEFIPAWKLVLERREGRLFSETGLVDARSGRLFLRASNIWTGDKLSIGSGTGQRGGLLKFPVTFASNVYYLWDSASVRPFQQRTYNCSHSFPASVAPYSSANNTWPADNVIDIHANVGYCYDYLYTRFGLRGMDNNNKQVNGFAHLYYPVYGLADNAFYSSNGPYGPGIYFLDPYRTGMDFGAAIDVVVHEFCHGVTDYHSNLTYYGESGALNESFSDIFGTAVEFAFQQEGVGYNKADWYNGEDANPVFSYDRCRSQSDPNSNSQLKNAGFPSAYWYPDPCHISQKIPTLYSGMSVVDYDGVHLNATIFPHSFYLLAHGGTNKVSGLNVTGIGIEKAAKIFYNAFVNHMTGSDDFLATANKIIQSAAEVYGGSSSEFSQTKQAMRAIGYTSL